MSLETLDVYVSVIIPRDYIVDGVSDDAVAMDVVQGLQKEFPEGIAVCLQSFSNGLLIEGFEA